MRGLYEYNYPSNNELSVFTGQQYFFIFHREASCSLAPPHHFVVPSPYKQGESAIRTINSARFFLLFPFSFLLSHHPFITSAGFSLKHTFTL